MRAKPNSRLNTSFCVVRRWMQSVPIISPSQTCQTCSAKSPHVASLIYKRNWILSPNLITISFLYFWWHFSSFSIFVHCIYSFKFILSSTILGSTNSYRLPRRDEIIIHRLRIGHTFLTRGYLLTRDCPPQCSACLTQLTVETTPSGIHWTIVCPMRSRILMYPCCIAGSTCDYSIAKILD